MLTGWARGLGEPCAGPWTGLCGAASQYDPPWGAMPLVHRSGDPAVTGDHATSAPQAMPRGGAISAQHPGMPQAGTQQWAAWGSTDRAQNPRGETPEV